MPGKAGTRRVVTFLTREELDFLDKLEKDVMFSGGKYISRSQILQNAAELLTRTHMDATGAKDNAEFMRRMEQAIARMYQEEEQGQKGV